MILWISHNVNAPLVLKKLYRRRHLIVVVVIIRQPVALQESPLCWAHVRKHTHTHVQGCSLTVGHRPPGTLAIFRVWYARARARERARVAASCTAEESTLLIPPGGKAR